MADINIQIQDIINKQTDIINNLNSILSLSADSLSQIANLQSTVQTLASSNLFTNFQTFNNSIFNVSNYYQQIYNILNKKYFLFNFIENNYTESIDINNLTVKLFDETFTEITSFDSNINNNSLNLLNIDSSINTCFVKIQQNLLNTQIYSDTNFNFSSKTDISQNITSVLITLDNPDDINTIYKSNKLNNTLLLVNGISKYRVVRFGGTVQDKVKYLTLHVFPNILENTINNLSVHNYLFDDLIIEIDLLDYDLNDISSFYFNDAERNLDTQQLTIFDKLGFPKYNFNYSISGNIESRMTYGR
jgi:hypothetical protein